MVIIKYANLKIIFRKMPISLCKEFMPSFKMFIILYIYEQ